MLLILAPSKTQDFESPLRFKKYTQLRTQSEVLELVKELKSYSQKNLGKLMHMSDKLAKVNFERYQNFQNTFTPQNARQALLAFKGDVYTDVDVENYTEADFDFAQKHLRTLSGLYGVLRPLDLIQPYRLEMQTKLKTSRGKNLYEFWGDQITELTHQDLADQGDDVLVNLTSQEYFKSLNPKKLKAQVIEIVFLEKKEGQEPKMITIFTKRARGTMANWAIKNRIQYPKDLKGFDVNGYRFEVKLSDGNEFAFVREI